MATYGVITGRVQAMRNARTCATALHHVLTKFHPIHTPSTNPYSPDEYRAECMLCGEEVFVAYKGLEWRVMEATTYQETCTQYADGDEPTPHVVPGPCYCSECFYTGH